MLRRASTSIIKNSCCCACHTSKLPLAVFAKSASTSAAPESAVRNPSLAYYGRSKPGTSRRARQPSNPQKKFPSSDAKTPRLTTVDPYSLSSRIKLLCESDRLDEAVDLLRRARRDTINAVVYNTLIHQVLMRKKNKLAWQLWMEVSSCRICILPCD